MMSEAGPIVIMGAGAVGGYVGGMLGAAGEDIILIDAWPAHVEAIRADGLKLDTPEGMIKSRPRALHICDVHQLVGQPVGLAFLCVKLYDTNWAATLLGDIGWGQPDRHDAERARRRRCGAHRWAEPHDGRHRGHARRRADRSRGGPPFTTARCRKACVQESEN